MVALETMPVPVAAIAKPKTSKIPDYLVKETIDGIAFYYAGYRAVLNKTKTIEEIMADSGLQSYLKSFLHELLILHMDRSKYLAFVGEVGTHTDHRNNLSLDIAIYDKKILTPDKITTKYLDVAPKVVLEIDVNVALEQRDANIFEEFVLRKVRKLFSLGTEKIVWIFSKSKTVIVARPGITWEVLDWDKDVELIEGVVFNIARHLEAEGFVAQ